MYDAARSRQQEHLQKRMVESWRSMSILETHMSRQRAMDNLIRDCQALKDCVDTSAQHFAIAGMKFSAVGEYQSAAEAYSLAASASSAENVWPMANKPPHQLRACIDEVSQRRCKLCEKSGSLWILAAQENNSEGHALHMAKKHFLQAGLHQEAFHCLLQLIKPSVSVEYGDEDGEDYLASLPSYGHCNRFLEFCVVLVNPGFHSGTLQLPGVVSKWENIVMTKLCLAASKDQDMTSMRPVRSLLEVVVQCCFDQSATRCLEILGGVSHFLRLLLSKLSGYRVKLQVLREIQHSIHRMCFPKLPTPGWTLFEAVFHGLYIYEIVEEQYFFMWMEEVACQPLARCGLDQVGPFLEWLKTGDVEEPH